MDGDAPLDWMRGEFSPNALKPITQTANRAYPGTGNPFNVIACARVAAYAYGALADAGLLDWVSDEPAETGDALAQLYRKILEDGEAFSSWRDPEKAKKTFEEELVRLEEAVSNVRGAPGVAQRVVSA